MDYEVFLLSRVKEARDAGANNVDAVAIGLARSGRVITSAALVVIVVSLAFVSADIVLIKAVGLGAAIAIFVDATVIRSLLVPATLRLLGKWNWWAPTLPRVSGSGARVDAQNRSPVFADCAGQLRRGVRASICSTGGAGARPRIQCIEPSADIVPR